MSRGRRGDRVTTLALVRRDRDWEFLSSIVKGQTNRQSAVFAHMYVHTHTYCKHINTHLVYTPVIGSSGRRTKTIRRVKLAQLTATPPLFLRVFQMSVYK